MKILVNVIVNCHVHKGIIDDYVVSPLGMVLLDLERLMKIDGLSIT